MENERMIDTLAGSAAMLRAVARVHQKRSDAMKVDLCTRLEAAILPVIEAFESEYGITVPRHTRSGQPSVRREGNGEWCVYWEYDSVGQIVETMNCKEE